MTRYEAKVNGRPHLTLEIDSSVPWLVSFNFKSKAAAFRWVLAHLRNCGQTYVSLHHS
jgi:hypothetical protein